MVKQKILSFVLAFCMAFMLIPTTAFAANETVGTLAALQTAITNAAGTEENPTVIVISGQIEVNQTVKIPAGKYIKLVGENSNDGLIRADSFTSASGSVTNISHLLSVQGSLVLEDITIDGDNKSGGSLVFIYGNNAFAVMNEGTTLKNNLNGAVQLYSQNSTPGNPCHFIMNGGTICNNSASQGAGVAIINYGYADFTMNGGEIRDNTATSAGGGGAIYSCANGTVTISSGEIIENKSTGSNVADGGAMNVTGRSALVITGGEISNNHITTSMRGGGIYKSGNAAFTMTGGVIKDNSTARNDGREGQDIYIASGDFNLGGTAQIPDGLFIERYKNSSGVNFYITSPLQNNIGIEGLWASPSTGRVVAVGKDYTITQSDFEKISYNHASLVLKFDKDNNQIVLGKPSYTVAYTLSDMTFDGPEDIENGNSLTTTLNPSVGYHSPSSITVKINGVELDRMNYQAVPVQGGIGVYIPAEYVTGNVEISAVAEAHFGGTATCTALAVCTGCRQSYGSVNPDNHTGAVVWVQTETTHKQVYNCCQTEVSAEESHNWENGKCTVCEYPCSHTGGTATCSQLAICTICKSQYGELDLDNHKPVSEWTQENGKHYHKCEYGCDTHLDETNCFGGEATCTEKAVCEICFNPYGEINASNHTNLVKTEAKAATHLETGNKEYWYCDGCNKYFSDEAGTKEITLESTVIPKLTEHSSGGGGSSGYSYYTIKATAGAGGSISPSGNVSVREGRNQTFTITPDKGYAVSNVKIDGKSIGAVKSYTFENVSRTHTIEVIFMKANGNPQTGVFVDVATGSYYEDAVDWAVENGITTGVSANRFDPNGVCTRAQAVTFLWRAAGSPEPETRAMPFADVPVGSYYYDAVLWAVENGITKGTSDTTFSPDATCSRAQIVTFLWRSEKSPAAGTANPFADVKSDAYYADAVVWAVKVNITKGTTNITFSPDADCTRAQIVTFLWRCKK